MEIKVDQVEKRSWTEVDLKQIEKNLQVYKSHLKKNVQIMAVIKADAYGHGDVMVARTLSRFGVKLFAVSNIDEAVGLRNAGIAGEILILGYTSPKYAKTLSYLDLTQAIVSEEYAIELAKSKYDVKCHVAVDTGMTRVGIPTTDANQAAQVIREMAQKLTITGMFTHLCVADSSTLEDKDYTMMQLSRFKAIADNIKDLNLPYMHCYNSAGGLYYLEDNDFNATIGNIVRLGIILYGLKPDRSNVIPKGIKPALTWRSVISMVKDVPQGQSIGYGRTFITQRDSRIATVTTGYADGYRRQLSNKGFIMVNGKKAPIVGRVCMDQILIDVTDISNVTMGDKVVLMGESGDLCYTADDMAADLDTIGYEVICDITKRVQRFYPEQ
ncbi:MAG: alanine racemase [Bacteroidaceae bacterium]|nr:alanine racemase [Bacteroidaceae bacterium]